MTALYSVILSFLMLLCSFSLPFTNAPVPENPEDGFVPVMRFIATSDTHIQTLGDKGCSRVTKMIKSAYAIAESDADYKGLDAAVFCGDITDNGTFTAFSAFTATTNKVIRDGTERLAVVAKSHDGGTYSSDSLEMFTALTGQETDFHRVISGFHFIGVSRADSESEHYTGAQINWLDEQLSSAVADDPAKPVFVFQHEHVKNTVYGSTDKDGWGMDTFTEVLNKYPQAIHISGHSHYPANDPRTIWQGTFTAINDGGLAYFEFTVDDENTVHPENHKTMTQALVIEVDASNNVLVRVLDVDAGEFVAEYLIDNVSDPVKTKYAPEYRKAASVAPVFDDGAALGVKNNLGKYTVSVPQAKTGEDNKVFLYRISITASNGSVVYSSKELSQYYFAAVPEAIEFTGISLKGGTYTVSVHAEDVWGNISQSLTAEICA